MKAASWRGFTYAAGCAEEYFLRLSAHVAQAIMRGLKGNPWILRRLVSNGCGKETAL